jgi:hypothetical protein
MHLRKGHRQSKKDLHLSSVVEFDELEELITAAFAFYTALFSLYERCRGSFTDFENAIVPYDVPYKGLLELLFDSEDKLIGFHVYWPNGSYSMYARSLSGIDSPGAPKIAVFPGCAWA